MKNRKPALFIQVTWRDAHYVHNGAACTRSLEISRELPEKPIISGGITGFEMAEMLTRAIVTNDVPITVQKKRRMADENDCVSVEECAKNVLCANSTCGKRARAGVAWYPFDISTWLGDAVPDMKEKMPPLEYDSDDERNETDSDGTRINQINKERFTMGIPVMAWCGTNPECKSIMTAFMLNQYWPVAQKHNLTGGGPHCWQCGCTDLHQLKIYEKQGAWCTACDTPPENGGRKLCSQYALDSE